ncbi:MAG: sigma-70 family RNA polymerase sigma factor [Acidobacteria bacterium]|nr:sigma-70 family RNA polymerase sigma factor [Acidobacteriota bacterium]
MASVTHLLIQWSHGDPGSRDELFRIVQQELHRIADRYMRRERPDHTLQTTALVNEAYLRLIEQPQMNWQNRAHFYAISARVMRQILVDHARRTGSVKRGGERFHVPFDEALVFSPEKSSELLALDEALKRLAEKDARKAEIVELRYFGGLDVEEVAEALRVHPNTVIRDWALAKAWLKREMSPENL